MTIYVDTSAFYALLDADDQFHSRVLEIWGQLLSQDEFLLTNNYIIVETLALVQNRLGMAAAHAFQNDVLPTVNFIWVDEEIHTPGVSAMLAANRRKLSLVDCTSFETMRRLGIKKAFTIDQHFVEQGFEILS